MIPPINDTKIEVRNVRKSFGAKVVLSGVTFDVKNGESVVLLGGSGSGKSVLFKIIAGLLAYDSGLVKINLSDKKDPFAAVGFTFQLNALFDSLKIWQNICFRDLQSGNYASKTDLKKHAKTLLTRVMLDPTILELYPSEISGGMQKRVAIARSLASNPEILFFDEPTAGLDPLTSRKISELIYSISNPTGIKPTRLSIMHDIAMARIVADKIAFLYNGKIEWFGDVKDLDHSGNQYLDEFIKVY
jgi:phospholipid/cholesterol/gamma-HCH transport system ATP-binding protein